MNWRRGGLAAFCLCIIACLELSRHKDVSPLTSGSPVSKQKEPSARYSFGAQLFSARQLPYQILPASALHLPEDLAALPQATPLPREIPGRRVPPLARFAELKSPDLNRFVIPLPEANTLAHINFQNRRFGQLQTSSETIVRFNPETILVKFHDQPHVGALRVEPNREWDAVQTLLTRDDVQFAELDVFQERQFSPNDSLLANQWHHQTIGSFQAWDISLGSPSIRIAIVDTPFQMNHPDLAANTANGWDAVANVPVTSGNGIVHSTICAGMAAAAIGNNAGVAGAGNCTVLPVNINGAISEMYNATIWAANNGVRVVNISWSGADSDTLETAGNYLKTNASGILVMSAIDGVGTLNYTNQPDIYCVAMTDQADNFQSTKSGAYVDFAAPGWNIFSTTINGGYGSGSGTSYAAPLFAGVVGVLLSVNPTLQPDEVIQILKNTATDLGPAGLDPYYGFGRINFAAAAAAARSTLPSIIDFFYSNNMASVSANFRPGLAYILLQTQNPASSSWVLITNSVSITNGNIITLTDPSPPPGKSFYRVQARAF